MGSSELTQRAIEQATAAARTPGPVLIVGAGGVGKSHFARAVHAWSPRASGPLVEFSAAATPTSNQAEALFGGVGAPGALAQAAEAHRALEGRTTSGKVLLIPG